MDVRKFTLCLVMLVVLINKPICTQGAPWEKQTCAFFCPMIIGNLCGGSLGALMAAPLSVAASIVLDSYYASKDNNQIKADYNKLIKEKKKNV